MPGWERRIANAGRCFVISSAIEQGCVCFDWTVDDDNTGALSFYRRLNADHVTSELYFRLAGEALEELARAPS